MDYSLRGHQLNCQQNIPPFGFRPLGRPNLFPRFRSGGYVEPGPFHGHARPFFNGGPRLPYGGMDGGFGMGLNGPRHVPGPMPGVFLPRAGPGFFQGPYQYRSPQLPLYEPLIQIAPSNSVIFSEDPRLQPDQNFETELSKKGRGPALIWETYDSKQGNAPWSSDPRCDTVSNLDLNNNVILPPTNQKRKVRQSQASVWRKSEETMKLGPNHKKLKRTPKNEDGRAKFKVPDTVESPSPAERPIGFSYDAEGYLEAYLHGQLIHEAVEGRKGKEVVCFGIWFKEDCELNRGESLKQAGNESVHAALIQGAERLFRLVKDKIEYRKVRVLSGPFLSDNAERWIENGKRKERGANWTELKYVMELKGLCLAAKGLDIKWSLADPAAVGTAEAKALAKSVQGVKSRLVTPKKPKSPQKDEETTEKTV